MILTHIILKESIKEDILYAPMNIKLKTGKTLMVTEDRIMATFGERV